ncbi:hypothetical protein [Corynebacterium occultum]|uniref:hypothetical protein n=1 Tax=Corynebacterium occultum TaxID=2675219 RepID=UPI0012E14AC8|nr:hypothetical protein [Corynebacterium occultum]
MSELRVIRAHAGLSIASIIAWIVFALVLSAVSFKASVLSSVIIGCLAVISSVGCLIAFWFARRAIEDEGKRGNSILFVIGALCLVVGWGTSVAGWFEEYQAGSALPIINLGFLLLPIGAISAIAATRAKPQLG